jgi:hypothetical protein
MPPPRQPPSTLAAAAAALALAAAPRAAAAAPPPSAKACADYGRLDFFPQGFPNEPAAWTREGQAKAGNADRYSLFPIALYGNPWPKLHFLPIHPLTLPGSAPAPPECRSAPSSRRRALAEAGAVRRPAAFTWETSLDGGPAQPGWGEMTLTSLGDVPHWSRSVWDLQDVSGGGGRRC